MCETEQIVGTERLMKILSVLGGGLRPPSLNNLFLFTRILIPKTSLLCAAVSRYIGIAYVNSLSFSRTAVSYWHGD